MPRRALPATGTLRGPAPPSGSGGPIGGKADVTARTRYAVTAQSVQALKRDQGAVASEVAELFPGDPLSIGAYLAPMSCPGDYGPLGRVGSHGHTRDSSDRSLKGRQIVRNVHVPQGVVPESASMLTPQAMGCSGRRRSSATSIRPSRRRRAT